MDHIIDSYWIESNSDDIVRILPDGSTNILFNTGDKITISEPDGNIKTFTDNIVIGVQKMYFDLIKSKDTYIIGVRFKQGQAYHFFTKSMAEIANKATNLSEVLNVPANSIDSILSKTKNTDEITKSLNYFFFINTETLPNTSKAVSSVINKVKTSKTSLLIKDLCKSENITNKHLISLFNKKVGLTPKLLYRINKFSKVIESLKNNKADVNWSQLAFECNYYDQAHLINEFENFSGLTPKQYFDSENAMGLRVIL